MPINLAGADDNLLIIMFAKGPSYVLDRLAGLLFYGQSPDDDALEPEMATVHMHNALAMHRISTQSTYAQIWRRPRYVAAVADLLRPGGLLVRAQPPARNPYPNTKPQP